MVNAAYSDLQKPDGWQKVARAVFEIPQDAIIGWHFVDRTKTLGYGDGRPVVVGETLSLDNDLDFPQRSPRCCKWGLHAGTNALEAYNSLALHHNDGKYISLVWVKGKIHNEGFKFCGLRRHCLAMRPNDSIVRGLMQDYFAARDDLLSNDNYEVRNYLQTIAPAENVLHIALLSLLGIEVNLLSSGD